MKYILILCLLIILQVFTMVHAQEQKGNKEGSVKALSGMAIVGNDDAPKALYIVPWKSSEVGIETTPDMPAVKGYTPVDPDVFKRKLDYYYFSTTKDTGR